MWQSERSQLQKTVSNLTGGLSDANAGSDADVVALAASGISWKDLVRENQELRSENANMYILKEVRAPLCASAVVPRSADSWVARKTRP